MLRPAAGLFLAEVNPVLLLQHPAGPRQRQLRQVVLVEALDQVGLRGGQRGLRIDQRQIVVHAGVHAVGFVAQRLRGQIDIRARHVNQLLVGCNVEQRRAHLLVDVDAQIGELIIHRLHLRPAKRPHCRAIPASRKMGSLMVPYAMKLPRAPTPSTAVSA